MSMLAIHTEKKLPVVNVSQIQCRTYRRIRVLGSLLLQPMYVLMHTAQYNIKSSVFLFNSIQMYLIYILLVSTQTMPRLQKRYVQPYLLPRN